MEKGKSKETGKRDDLPDSFESIAEAGAFWDQHDSADFEDMMQDVDFEVDIKRRVYLVPIAGQILEALRARAKSEGLSTETLVNLLLRDHAGYQETGVATDKDILCFNSRFGLGHGDGKPSMY